MTRDNILRLVTPAAAPSAAPPVRFCGHCAEAPRADDERRICSHCHMGVILEADADLAPRPGQAFLVVDDHLSVCALSDAAAALLGTDEESVVNTPVSALLEPADVAGNGASNLATVLIAGGELREVAVRPSGQFGIRYRARVGTCGLPVATLIVLDRFGPRVPA